MRELQRVIWETACVCGLIICCASGAAAVEIINSGFEAPDAQSDSWIKISALEDNTDGVGGWTFSGVNCGVAYNNSTWCITAPEGVQVAYLKFGNTISTTFATTRLGTYKLTFRAADRQAKWPAGHLAVLIDGVQVAYWTSAEITNDDQFRLYTVDLGILSIDTHTLTFQGWDPGEDSATLIDDVVITLENPFNFWSPDPLSSNWNDTVWATVSGGIPDQSWSAGDLAVFDQPQSYTVTVDTAVSAGIVYVDAGDVTFVGTGGVDTDELRVAAGATLRGEGECYLKSGVTSLILNGTLDLTALSDTTRTVDLIAGSGELIVSTNLSVNGTATFSGAVSGGGNLTKIGEGKLQIDNSLTGDIAVNSGYLTLQNAASGTISVASDAGLSFTDFSDLLGELADSDNDFTGNAMIGLHNAGALTDPALAGVDYGTLRFLKTGAGVLKIESSSVLAGVTGGVVVAEGELEYGGTDAIAPDVPIEVKPGARLYMNNIVEVFDVSHPLIIAGNIDYTGTGNGAMKVRIVTRTANFNAPVTVAGDTKIKIYSSNSTVNFNAPFNGVGDLVISSSGAGELHAHQMTFKASSTFEGDVTLMNDLGASSYFYWGVDDVLPAGAVLYVGSTQWNSFTYTTAIDLKGYNQTIAGLADGVTVHNDTVRVFTNSMANGSTLTMEVAAEDQPAYTGVMGGGIELVKSGDGAQMLTGDGSARSGRIAVQAGSMLLDESYLLQAETVEVLHGATLRLDDAGGVEPLDSVTILYAGLDKSAQGETAVLDIPAGVNVTVRQFAVDGVFKHAGTWGAVGSGADYINDNLFNGSGTLTVLETGPLDGTRILIE
jgi:hypothetical protein